MFGSAARPGGRATRLAAALGLLLLRAVLPVLAVPGVVLVLGGALGLVVPLAADVGRVGIGRAAGDRLALVLVGVVDLLPVDADAAVVVVLEVGRAELLLGTLVPRVVALGAPER